MDLLSISPTLSPQILPKNPASSFKFRHFYPPKSPLFNPNFQITPPTLRSSSSSSIAALQFDQSTTNPPIFDNLGFGNILASSPQTVASSPQTAASARRGAEADVMGMLLRERIVFMGNEIDEFMADAIIGQLMLLDAQDHTKDIRLFINSPGGSLSASMAIYDVVRLIRADVSTIALGIAASTASIILGGGTKGKRFAMPNARIMIHQPLGGAGGKALDVDVQARELVANKKNVIRIISEFSGRSLEQVEEDIDRDRYMSPIEAVEYGLLDGVIDRDSIVALEPVPDTVDSDRYEEIHRDTMKFIKPDIPDDEIY